MANKSDRQGADHHGNAMLKMFLGIALTALVSVIGTWVAAQVSMPDAAAVAKREAKSEIDRASLPGGRFDQAIDSRIGSIVEDIEDIKKSTEKSSAHFREIDLKLNELSMRVGYLKGGGPSSGVQQNQSVSVVANSPVDAIRHKPLVKASELAAAEGVTAETILDRARRGHYKYTPPAKNGGSGLIENPHYYRPVTSRKPAGNHLNGGL